MQKEIEKLRHYCAYQERSHYETRHKCLELGLRGAEVEEALATLVADNFLNEERFAKAFAGGKFRIRQWGRKKIILELKQKQVSAYCIKKAMEEIDENDYAAVLLKLADKKYRSLEREQPLKRKYKTMQHLLQKGFESDLISDALEQIVNNEA
ncbi:regulatory protein RecX [Chitinophaga nivalis]|uniref:Regulatory protein RecX n=1 Tax=Chitinophaga nivalis TaxID=2991709 RepID=A0ABT3IW08_9BACT|nr:regulatory protein RecX [Chitinophaga nivalis]MCW3462144.1 RecX family transcriptional regulator [Chitinophaga nivalis]MCW3488164.1 RecX family transcriptional regulator [Chitinophaga nivalis]